MDRDALTKAIKAEAQRLGFVLVGVTKPEAPPHYKAFTRWVESEQHGEMTWLASERSLERRSNPKAILPECRSILVLGTPYPANYNQGTPSSEPAGRVASYAWGSDYHDVLPERMRSLIAFIEEHVGEPIPNRWYTDTGPVLERDFAQQAGIGWIGKNTCLINPQKGSYFLLAEILLGLELTPDEPLETDHCGSCTRCLEACPTGCILPDRTIDSRSCISYLTIELKGSIPLELRPKLGDWIFGCDVCQQVCPWNLRFAPERGDPAFDGRPGVPQPKLIAELALTPEEFNRKFRGSPVKRAKRRGYLRNIAVALGNAGDPASVPALARALREEPEPLVRQHVAWALGRIRGAQALAALHQGLEVEGEPEVLAEIRQALVEAQS